jgi:hypothetical protein
VGAARPPVLEPCKHVIARDVRRAVARGLLGAITYTSAAGKASGRLHLRRAAKMCLNGPGWAKMSLDGPSCASMDQDVLREAVARATHPPRVALHLRAEVRGNDRQRALAYDAVRGALYHVRDLLNMPL